MPERTLHMRSQEAVRQSTSKPKQLIAVVALLFVVLGSALLVWQLNERRKSQEQDRLIRELEAIREQGIIAADNRYWTEMAELSKRILDESLKRSWERDEFLLKSLERERAEKERKHELELVERKRQHELELLERIERNTRK